MASLQIEGDTAGLRDTQINFIRDVLEKRGFKNNKVVFEPASKTGDNFVAQVKRIIVVAEDGKDFNIIAKFAPEQEALRQIMNTAMLFNNESVMYEQVLPKLVSLQKAAGVPDEDLLRYAECYGCTVEAPNEVILLEDLNDLDYIMLDKLSPLSDTAVKLVLKDFAILHSLSYALKKLEPETYDEFRNKLIDMWHTITVSEQAKSRLNQLECSATAVVDDKYKKCLRGMVSGMPELSVKVKKANNNSKHLVIQQGDGWTNNILFKFKGDEPIKSIMIDYQASREANPVCDILYLVFNCTDHLTRERYYLDWIDYYHDQLDKSLSNFGMKANFVYPRDQLDVDLKWYSKLYFGISIRLNSVLIRKPEEVKAFQDALKKDDAREKMKNHVTVNSLSEDTVQLYKSRVENLIQSYQHFGYL